MTEKVAGVHRKGATPGPPRMNRGDRSKLTCTELVTRASSTPPAGPSQAGGEENPREATRGHPETTHLHPALLKEGREEEERPGVQDFRRSHQERTSVQWNEEPEGRKKFAQANVGKHFQCDEGQSKHMSQPNSKF